MMQESDTYLMILEEGEEKGQVKRAKEDVLLVGEERFGAPDPAVKAQLDAVTDLERLVRMMRRAVKGKDWKEVVETE